MTKLWNFLRSFWVKPEHRWRVSLAGNILSCVYQGHQTDIDLNKIEKIFIRTTDQGPWAPDVFWIFEGDGKTIIFPQTAIGEPEIRQAFFKLPGVDLRASIEASLSVQNEIFKFFDRENPVDSSQWKDTRPTLKKSDFTSR